MGPMTLSLQRVQQSPCYSVLARCLEVSGSDRWLVQLALHHPAGHPAVQAGGEGEGGLGGEANYIGGGVGW